MENGNLNETTTSSSRPVTATASAETVTPAGSGGSGSSVKSGIGRLGQSAYRQSSATTLMGTNQTTLLTATRCLLPRLRETISNMKGAGECLSSTSSSSVPTAAPQSISQEAQKDLQTWLDKVTFTRQRKHLHRDFSDGVLMAEVVAHFFPKMIELHNYAGANNTSLKKNNWDLLNRKVLPKLGIKLQDSAIENICLAKSGYIEQVLNQIRKLIDKKSEEDEQVKTRELARIANRDCGDGEGGVSSVPLTEANCLVHVLPNNVPEFIIYRGQKYLPELSMDEKIKEIGELKNTNKELTNKVRRLETLVNLKENHLEDLTRQLHELRIKHADHECVCKFDDGE